MILTPENLSLRTLKMLDTTKMKYKLIQHSNEGRCEEVSLIRGHDPSEAIKAILVTIKKSQKNKDRVLALLPGNAFIDFDKLKILFNARSAGMSSPMEVESFLESEPGRVPPFSFNPNVQVIIDKKLVNNQNVYFSAGKTDESIKMDTKDFVTISLERGAKILTFTS
jgi:Ala-tRNA(Pro) deacylase